MKLAHCFHIACLLALSVPAAHSAAADKYPARPITLVVPQAPGGGSDTMARIYAEYLGRELKQAVIVDNRPGAGGNIGTAYVAKAAPDGYTLLKTGSGPFDANPSLFKNAGFNPIRDFEPVALLGTAAYLLVANSNFPPNTVKEMIDYAKAKPGTVFYASAGNGTPNHLLGEVFKRRTGTDMTHVPYKGAAAAAKDVAAGLATWSLQSVPSAQAFISAGKLKVLATAGATREKAYPQVPTVAETVPGFSTTVWYGVFAPRGTPPEVVAKLHAASARVLANPEVQQKLAQNGVEAKSMDITAIRSLVRTGVNDWGNIIRETGITID